MTQKIVGGGDKFAKLESAIVQDNEQFIQGQHQRQQVSKLTALLIQKANIQGARRKFGCSEEHCWELKGDWLHDQHSFERRRIVS